LEVGKLKAKVLEVQMNTIPLDVKVNLEKAEFFTRRATEKACDIICFREDFLTGTVVKEVPEQDTDAIFVDACASARAIENEIIHVFVNNTGRQGELTLLGHTQINIPFYGTVTLVETNEEKLLIKGLDLDLVDLAEEVYRLKGNSIGRVIYETAEKGYLQTSPPEWAIKFSVH